MRFLLFPLAVAQLKILTPPELAADENFEDGVIYGTTAVFGSPEYGRRTLGRLVFSGDSTSPMCEDDDYNFTPSVDGTKTIFIVRRGQCTFVHKVRAAQRKGVDAVVVVDDVCGSEHNRQPCRDREDIQRIIMASDGTGEEIHIPSVLIAADQGEILFDAMKASLGGDILAMLLWDLPRTDFVAFDFWMSTGASDAMGFLAAARAPMEALGTKVQFVPHFFIFNTSSVISQAGCLAIETDGKVSYYCDPQMSKQEVVKEDLRQLCIWHTHKFVSGSVFIAPKYWQYISTFYENCHPGSTQTRETFTAQCAQDAMHSVGIDVSSVNWCMENYQPPECRANPTVASCKENLVVREASHRAWSPHAVRINGWRYSGPLEPNAVARQICSAFLKWPSECEDAVNDKVPTVGGGGVSFLTVIILFLLLTSVMAVILIAYRQLMRKNIYRSLREEVMLEVRAQMQDYTMLVEQGDAAPPRRQQQQTYELGRFGRE